VEIQGFDLRVGQKPKPATYTALYEFNKAFLEMFSQFRSCEPGSRRVVMVWMESRGPLSSFGSLTLTHLRNWLRYYQLVTVEKQVEPLPEPNGPFKNRTKWIVEPTVRGWNAYENGMILELDCGVKTFSLGIGKPYTTWERIFAIVSTVWNQQKIARSRQDQWYQEVKSLYEQLLDKTSSQAERLARDWALEKALNWNRKKKRIIKNAIKKPAKDVLTGEIPLPKGQKTL